METMDRLKEELKRRFNIETYGKLTQYERNELWDFFWQEIEAREKAHKIELSNYAYQMDLAKRERDQAEAANTILEGALKYQREQTETQQAKISRLESTLVVADKGIEYLREAWTPTLMLREAVWKVFFGEYDKLKEKSNLK